MRANIREQQKIAFAALGCDLVQQSADRVPHGRWMTETLRGIGADDTILFVDIDCVALDADIVERAFVSAERGRVFGVAQVANHIDPAFIFAAPSFLCVSRRTWCALGSPDLMPDEAFDAGARLSACAQDHGVPVDLLMPSFSLEPKWLLSTRGCYGIGTFYEAMVFHLFESRNETGWNFAFDEVCRCVSEGRPIDYLGLYKRVRSPAFRLALLRGRLRRRRERIGRSIRKRIGRDGTHL